jgi:hypothetical protein
MYRSRGEEVNRQRLIFTGDVFENVAIPMVQESGMAIVIEHPCAIRGSHGRLNDHVLVAGVSKHDPVGANGWTTRHYDLTPLPDLVNSELYVGEFSKIGRAQTSVLKGSARIACSSVFGINLLQQRLVWDLTRCLVPTHTFAEAFSHTFEEADIAEDWIEVLTGAGFDEDEAISAFDQYLTRDSGGGRSLQRDLEDIQMRAAVRKSCKIEAEAIAAARRGG